MSIYLHDHKEFANLLKIVSAETGIIEQLIEKDYWLMHVLYGLKEQGFEFELKGGTSLSKGYKIIDRFSEDIDIFIKPPANIEVEINPNKRKEKHSQSRKRFYDYLANQIKIDGIIKVERDHTFDNEQTYNSGGIRLAYNSITDNADGLKEGILLEVGFDTVTPNSPTTISSWAFEKATTSSGITIIDNRAIEIPCYHPGYTFVEKLQTITRKFRNEQKSGTERPNLMRQYYDVYCLLNNQEVKDFIGTEAYNKHKAVRFSTSDLEVPIQSNEAFLLSDPKVKERFKQRYNATAALYYKGQPDFENVLKRIHENLDRL
jgi:predicted nucleotidyltransferase component of viral defense system